MAQGIMSIRVDNDVRKDINEFSKKVGISVSTLVNLYFKKVIDEQKIPFEISVKKEPDRLGYIRAIEALREDVISKYPEKLSLNEFNNLYIKISKEYLNEEDNTGFKFEDKQKLIDGLNGMIWITNLEIENEKKYPNGVSLDEINEAIDEARRGEK